ncbi:DedA family protein [Thermodesulfovibrio thiophilus]|uniref:DedA family protein n=1 Tax=Thermodesulfovibrio thiophilus TaxID=340095 RepID=UPI0017A5E9CC|nr:DedA family protein [Thermodesulfovibrio thiophilus]HHW19711.1 DedA family protein [Thermodesulfovibrio thiophilus]
MDSYSIISQFSYPGLFFLLILGGIGVPFFPEDLILIACGVMISLDIIQLVPAVLISYAGLIISDFMLYWAGRKFGRKIVTNHRFERILSPAKLMILEKKFRKHSTLIMLLGRLLVGFRAQVFLLSGITRVSMIKFLIIDSFGSAVVLSIMITAGYLGGKFLESVQTGMLYMEYIVGFLVILVVILIIIYLSYKCLIKGNNSSQS